jgi:hypothetical protein
MSDPRLAQILNGVAGAPNPVMRLLDNCVELLTPDGDFIDAWELADVLVSNREKVVCALVTKH